jgi:S1-C subfamily serine protease
VVRVVSYVGEAPGDEPPRHPYRGLTEHRRGLGVVTEKTGVILTSYSILSRVDSGALASVVDVQGLGEDASHVTATVVGVEPTLDLAILQAQFDTQVATAALDIPEEIAPGTPLYAVTGRGKPALVHAVGTVAELPNAECYQKTMTPTMLRVKLDEPLEALGTPVFGSTGRLLALKTRHVNPEGQGEAESDAHLMPIELVFNIYDAIKTKRSAKSPWTGFSVRALSERERVLFPVQDFQGGIALEEIWEKSPAERMELNPGDILLMFGHYRIHSVADFQKWLYMHGVGHEVTLRFLRGGKVIEKVYKIEERPSWAVPR